MFSVGDRVRVVTGPWASDCGTVEKVTGRVLKVRLDSRSSGLALVNPTDAELIQATEPQDIPQNDDDEHPFDFSHSGLGIGGAGSHNLHDEAMELVARGEMDIRERQRIGPMPHGQLWEPCRKRGCDTEPVCLDCGYCEEHCTC